MRILLFSVFSFLLQTVFGQVTFVVNDLPSNHDYAKFIYISGDFEGWTGGIDAYKLEEKDSIYTISLPQKEETILFKFTLGSWQDVERDENGNQTDNRSYKFEKKNDTVFIKIASWDAQGSGTISTAAQNVSIISETFKIPQLNRERRIWIYLPPNYQNSNEHYPVLYMHDGQNIFDKTTSYSGEWGVDETLNSLFRTHNFKLIVVGIDNGGEHRMTEYGPWDHERFGKAEGKKYMDFIVNDLKPFIDNTYRTISDAQHTGIMGSSMGGLISHYAGLTYPTVFGKVGVFSPSFWYAEGAYELAQAKSSEVTSKMYFLMGGREGEQMVPKMNQMINLMKSSGFQESNISKKIVPEGKHNEQFWQQEFEEAIRWLFPEALKSVRTFESINKEANGSFTITVSDGTYTIQFYTDQIVETCFVPKGEREKKESHAVVLRPQKISTTMSDEENEAAITTEGLTVKIQKKPFKIAYWYKGKEVTSEKNGYRKIDDLETIQFDLTENEILYGGGARALGMNRRGNRLRLYNKADYGYESYSTLLNYGMPIVLSSKQYMIHFDNAPIGFLDLDSHQENTLTYESISGHKTYQVIVGDSWYDLIDNYTDLTGKQPLPPRWAFGNFASRFGYHSEKETRNTVQKFRDEKIPLDAVILDIFWFGKNIKGAMGNFEFYKDSFPTPKNMIQNFKNDNVKTILITEPFVLTTSKKWQEAVEKNVLAKDSLGNPYTYDFYFGNTGLIDVFDENGKTWFWNIYKELAAMGVVGVWGDLGEPEVHPSDMLHALGTSDEVHNIYGHQWAKLVYEGYQRDFPEQRPFILMRSGYSGSQRYGLIPWSGDVNRTWGGLKPQTEIALQMAMQGLGYMHSDLGGFAGANLDDELYTRWLQYGVFQPIYRPHAQESVPSEPVYREAKTKELAKKSIELRYQLLPYNYTLAFENHTKGTPLMRPLFFEEPYNKEYQNLATTYLWGNDFLVTPITKKGAEKVAVHFPKGNNWFDFYTGEKIKGGQVKEITTKPDYIPTYVRGGAFIPMANKMQSTEEYDAANLLVHFYYDSDLVESSTHMYDDDGKTPNAYEKGLYELLKFNSDNYRNYTFLNFSSEIGQAAKTKNRTIELILHNFDQEPKKIKVNKKKTKFSWSAEQKIVKLHLDWKNQKALQINILRL